MKNSQSTVVSTFASPHELTLQPKAYKRASAFPAQAAHRALGFADPQKNKINLCFLDRLVRIEKDIKMIAKEMNYNKIDNKHQLLTAGHSACGFKWVAKLCGS